MENTYNAGESYSLKDALRIARAGGAGAMFEVRAGIRHIGFYADSDVAVQMAEFYDAEVFDLYDGARC